MTAEKVLRITYKEMEVIDSLFEAVNDFVDKTESAEDFESVLRDVVEGIYNEQSVTDEYGIKILKKEEE